MNLRCQRHVFLAVFLLFFSLIVDTDDIYAQKLRVAYTAFAGTFTILWVGKEAGLYQKHRADMDLLFIGSSTTAVQALLGGDVDIVYSAAGAVVDANLSGAEMETLDATYKENVKEYALRIPYVAAAGLRSIVDFRSETAAEVKKLALDRMYDNSLLQEIQKEKTK